MLIVGSQGAGKYYLAEAIAAALLKIPTNTSPQGYPYFFHLHKADGKQDIPIDDVRSLISQLQLKTPGSSSTVRRVVIVEDAHLLSIPAQNAMLKTLEEPAADTVFLLTVPYRQSILPTVASRLHILNLLPVPLAVSLAHYPQLPKARIEPAWRFSRGSAGLLSALINNLEGHELKRAVEEVKVLLKQNHFERLLKIEQWSKDRAHLSLILEAFSRMLVLMHQGAIGRRQSNQAIKLLQARQLIADCKKLLAGNASTRLIGLELVLKLKI